MAFDLEGLYRTTYDSVVRFLYRKVWDADRAEDLAQEVFMRALPTSPRSRVPGSSPSPPTLRATRPARRFAVASTWCC